MDGRFEDASAARIGAHCTRSLMRSRSSANAVSEFCDSYGTFQFESHAYLNDSMCLFECLSWAIRPADTEFYGNAFF